MVEFTLVSVSLSLSLRPLLYFAFWAKFIYYSISNTNTNLYYISVEYFFLFLSLLISQSICYFIHYNWWQNSWYTHRMIVYMLIVIFLIHKPKNEVNFNVCVFVLLQQLDTKCFNVFSCHIRIYLLKSTARLFRSRLFINFIIHSLSVSHFNVSPLLFIFTFVFCFNLDEQICWIILTKCGIFNNEFRCLFKWTRQKLINTLRTTIFRIKQQIIE